MASDDLKASEPGTISSGAFEALVIVTIVLLTIIETVAAVVVTRALSVRFEGSWIGGMYVLNLVLARVVVDGILKRYGLSHRGKTREVWGRTVAHAEGDVCDDQTVEVRMPDSTIRQLFWICLFGCLLFTLGPILVPGTDTTTAILCAILAGACGLGALNLWWDRKPQAWADRDGITGYPSARALFRKFVPWSEVATCEIETFYNTFGKPVVAQPTLKDRNDRTLMTLSLLYTRFEDQERLVKYIKAKLPKPKDDFWE